MIEAGAGQDPVHSENVGPFVETLERNFQMVKSEC